MAALRILAKSSMLSSHLPKPNSSNPLLLPALLISCRGIASKLFVGGAGVLDEAHYENVQKTMASGFKKQLPLQTHLIRLSFYTTEKGFSDAFSQYGQVIEAKIVMDRVSDRSKGFGFITYASEDEADKAIAEMDGKQLNGRVVFVDYAKPQRISKSAMPIARGPPNPVPEN